MLRALAYDSGDDPAGVMRRLGKVMQGLAAIELVTAVIGRIEAPAVGPWQLHWTNAGHLPPLLALPDGHTLLLEEGHAPVLGVDPALKRESAGRRSSRSPTASWSSCRATPTCRAVRDVDVLG
jgi:hypothetical protein